MKPDVEMQNWVVTFVETFETAQRRAPDFEHAAKWAIKRAKKRDLTVAGVARADKLGDAVSDAVFTVHKQVG